MEKAWKMIGVACTIKNAAAGTETTRYNPLEADGDIIGVSVNQPYAADVCGNIYLTASQGSEKPLDTVPMSQLIPSAGQPYYPVKFSKSGQIVIVVETVTTDTATAKKPILVLHLRKPGSSSTMPGQKPQGRKPGCNGAEEEV